MTTYTNFDSYNGWVMPGSGKRVSFGHEDCYVDENGDLWVPCACCNCQNAAGSRRQEATQPQPTYNGNN